MLLGDIDTNGSLNAQMIHQFTDRIRGKTIIQVKSVNFFLCRSFCCAEGWSSLNPGFINTCGFEVTTETLVPFYFMYKINHLTLKP